MGNFLFKEIQYKKDLYVCFMKVLAENKKSRFDYQIYDKFEAGLVLTGQEVKSIKAGRVSLSGSYVVLKQPPEEFYLVGANIPAYQPKNAPAGYNPERSRKLLLKKSEIKHLIGKIRQKGLTLIPLRLYTKRGIIKLEFGVARGRKKANKKELIKKREAQRKIQRALRGDIV